MALFAHGHILRILTACWLDLPPQAGRLFALDTASVSILGYEREDLLVRGFQDITHPDDLGIDIQLLHSLVRGERDTFQQEKRYCRRDGSTVILGIHAVRGQWEGHPATIVMAEDVTERTRNDVMLRIATMDGVQPLAMRELNDVLGELGIKGDPLLDLAMELEKRGYVVFWG